MIIEERSRIGWIIGDQLDRSLFLRSTHLTSGGIGLVRYRWLADYVNTSPDIPLTHEIYRPWKTYDALIFLKSMGERSIQLMRKSQARGRPVIFDANVNYYDISGKEYYERMLPSKRQKDEAIEITSAVDGVIADSQFIMTQCRKYNVNVEWVSDSVRMDLVPSYVPWRNSGIALRLLWCGEAVKLFELLAIENVLLRYADRIELVIMTNSLQVLTRWYGDYRERFDRMMSKLRCQILPYRTTKEMFELYSQGGIFISPRFMDNPYNLGHTEWKITLPMACGRIALGSPLPSYETVAEKSGHSGIRICRCESDWVEAIDSVLSGRIDMSTEEMGARKVVEDHYATSVVARRHARFVRDVVELCPTRQRNGRSPGSRNTSHE